MPGGIMPQSYVPLTDHQRVPEFLWGCLCHKVDGHERKVRNEREAAPEIRARLFLSEHQQGLTAIR